MDIDREPVDGAGTGSRRFGAAAKFPGKNAILTASAVPEAAAAEDEWIMGAEARHNEVAVGHGVPDDYLRNASFHACAADDVALVAGD